MKETVYVKSDRHILNRSSRERANDVHVDFWFCSHLQPLAQAATWQPIGGHLQPLVTQASKCQHCTLSSLFKNCKISSSLALQKFGLFSRESLGSFHDFSAHSSGENRNFFAEQRCRNLVFSELRAENQNAHLLRAQ